MNGLIDQYHKQTIHITGKQKNKATISVSKDTTDEELLEFYSERYKDVDVENFLITDRKERFYGLINLVKKNEFYIDIGCANGGHMQQLYNKKIYGIGLDLSIPNIIKGIESKPHLKFVHGYAENIPFQDNYFDIAVMGDVIEHFRDQETTLAEILRVARKGFAICFPNDTKTTQEHVNPITINRYIRLCRKFFLTPSFYDFNGKKIDLKNTSNYYWVFSRATKTIKTNKVVNLYLSKNKTHQEDKNRVLDIDQWSWGEIHDRHHTEIDRFEVTSVVLKGTNILEIACGNGDLSVFLAKKGYNVTGIDISQKGITQCKKYAKNQNVSANTSFKIMDGTKLLFKENTFDSVIFPEVFEHVTSTNDFIEEAIRVLKPGGRIFVSVPNELEIPWPGHIRFFSKSTLRTELEQYTDNIIFHEMSHKKWLLCTFTPKEKQGEINENLPGIDIILPTYNRPDKIKQAINSIIDQTYSNWKLYIINDGGSDLTEIINQYKDKRIKYYNIKHLGKPGALNFGLSKSNASYISYMDDDDTVYPNHLETLLKTALFNKTEFVYSDTYLTEIDEKSGNTISQHIENVEDVNYDKLKFRNYINHKQILHSREILKKTGLYDTTLSILIDWDFIRRLAKIVTPFHLKLITGNHYLYYKNKQINSITGLWTRDPSKVADSLITILSKDKATFLELYQDYNTLTVQNKIIENEISNKKIFCDQLQAINLEKQKAIEELQKSNLEKQKAIEELQKSNLEKQNYIEKSRKFKSKILALLHK